MTNFTAGFALPRRAAHLLLGLPVLLLGCSQPLPGADSGGDTGNDTNGSGQTLCPIVDGAQWSYLKTSTSGQVLGTDNSVTNEVTWNGMQAWELVDEPNASGVTSTSTLIVDGTELLRVHREESDQSGTLAQFDYVPGFVRCSDTWTTLGTKMEFLYDRTASDANGLNPSTEPRGHTFEVLAVDEQITVPAGTFNCVKVERVRTVGTEAGALVWYWFAPGVGKVREERPIEMEIEELVSVSIPGGVNLP